jgi:hypothetical protein
VSTSGSYDGDDFPGLLEIIKNRRHVAFMLWELPARPGSSARDPLQVEVDRMSETLATQVPLFARVRANKRTLVRTTARKGGPSTKKKLLSWRDSELMAHQPLVG